MPRNPRCSSFRIWAWPHEHQFVSACSQFVCCFFVWTACKLSSSPSYLPAVSCRIHLHGHALPPPRDMMSTRRCVRNFPCPSDDTDNFPDHSRSRKHVHDSGALPGLAAFAVSGFLGQGHPGFPLLAIVLPNPLTPLKLLSSKGVRRSGNTVP